MKHRFSQFIGKLLTLAVALPLFVLCMSFAITDAKGFRGGWHDFKEAFVVGWYDFFG